MVHEVVQLPFDGNVMIAQQLVFSRKLGIHLLHFLQLLSQAGRFCCARIHEVYDKQGIGRKKDFLYHTIKYGLDR